MLASIPSSPKLLKSLFMTDENIDIIPQSPSDDATQPAGGKCEHCQGGCSSHDCSSGKCGGDNCGFCMWGDASLRGIAHEGCGRSDHQLNVYDYLADVPGNKDATDYVEVQFKNTRKGYYRNDNHLDLTKGDIVAVEAQPGHDIGVVTLTGQLVILQMQKSALKPGTPIRRIYRKARQADLEKYEEAKSREHDTMIRSRQIAKDLELQMKIGDVEYQGDGNKAIFYYIADQRVDFRKLIKVLAEAFHVRIEMKQIGARQEAGRIGGIGPCGRELCCATWMKNFNSVSTAAARFQDITPNPQKLAGQCAKLKCCLNYEVDTYMEASRRLPERNVQLETADGTFYFFKADTLAGLVTYSSDRRLAANLVTITANRAHEIIELNAVGEKPLSLVEEGEAGDKRSVDLAEQDELTRFDKARRGKNKRRQSKGGNGNAEGGERRQQGRGNRDKDDQRRNSPNEGQQQKGGNPRRSNNRGPRNGNRNNAPRRERDKGQQD